MGVSDEVKPQLTPEGKFALLVILCEFLTFALFLGFGKPELGLGACISVAVLMIAIRATWKLHEQRWYWAAVVFSVLVQVPFMLYFPWTNRAYRGTALSFLGILDFFVIWGCITLIARVTNRK
jgi:hypothetical protein